jgi:hypothetical protein
MELRGNEVRLCHHASFAAITTVALAKSPSQPHGAPLHDTLPHTFLPAGDSVSFGGSFPPPPLVSFDCSFPPLPRGPFPNPPGLVPARLGSRAGLGGGAGFFGCQWHAAG